MCWFTLNAWYVDPLKQASGISLLSAVRDLESRINGNHYTVNQCNPRISVG